MMTLGQKVILVATVVLLNVVVIVFGGLLGLVFSLPSIAFCYIALRKL